MKDNTTRNVIIAAVLLVGLCISIGFSFAYFNANIIGNEDAKPMSVIAGTMILTFKEGTDVFDLSNAEPGVSDYKTFSVTNDGTLDDEYNYNIKLAGVVTNFQKEDLKYILEECEDTSCSSIKTSGVKEEGFINSDTVKDGEMYLAVGIPRPEKKQFHYYKLTIEFQELNINQSYNKDASFVGKVNIDDNKNAKLLVIPKAFSEIIKVDNKNIFDDDPANNIRYAGADPNNYIWFNCNDYEGLTKDNATEKGCEKWRIIGLFKNITKTEGGQEDLVKIIRDSVGTLAWDSAKTNNWTNASLKPLLEGYYNGTTLSSAKGITEQTRPMIEQVTWNLGGNTSGTAQQFYTAERGTTVPSGAEATWDGYIGLMYPSDYGYATTGSSSSDRAACLTTNLSNYSSGCYRKDWLFSSNYPWTLTPYSSTSRLVFFVYGTGNVTSLSASDTGAVRASLYLKSNVQIANGKGTSSEPYIPNIA